MKINRLRYEMKELKNYKQFSANIDSSNENIWYISFKGADKTMYENEEFKLKFQFSEQYVRNNFL